MIALPGLQNETLADSRAGLAEDLRREIREQIKAGKTDQEIIQFLTARYGDFVLYRTSNAHDLFALVRSLRIAGSRPYFLISTTKTASRANYRTTIDHTGSPAA